MVRIEISNKAVYTIIAVIILLVVAGIVYAYNSNPANPAIMGHSANEIEGVCRTDGTGCPAGLGTGNIAIDSGIVTNTGSHKIVLSSSFQPNKEIKVVYGIIKGDNSDHFGGSVTHSLNITKSPPELTINILSEDLKVSWMAIQKQ